MITKPLQKLLYFKNPKKYTDNVLASLAKKKKSDIHSKLPGLCYSPYRGFSPWQYDINKQISSLKIELITTKKMALVLHKVDIWVQDSEGEISLIKTDITFNSSSLSESSVAPENINASHLKYTRTFKTNDDNGERFWEACLNTPQHILRVDVYGKQAVNCIKDVCVSVKDESGFIVASQCRGDNNFLVSQVSTQVIPNMASIALFLHEDGHKDDAIRLTEAFYALCTAQHSTEAQQHLLSALIDSFDKTLKDTPDFGMSPQEGLILDLLPGDTDIEFNNIGTPKLLLNAVFSSGSIPFEEGEPVSFRQIKPVKRESYRYQLTQKIPSAIRAHTFRLNFATIEAKSKIALYGGQGSVNKNGFIREVRIYNVNSGWRIENSTMDRYKCLIDILTFIEWLTGPSITFEAVSTTAKLCATYRFHNMRLFKSLYRKDKDLLALTIKTIKEKGCTAKYHDDVIFTRHGISVPFAVKDDQHLVNCTYNFCQWLENNLGLKPFPLYGTLLGIHREDRFLPHDDDIDLAVVVDLPEGLLPSQATRQWQTRIEAAGFKCDTLRASATNMHVHFTGHKMDLFIIYRNYGPNNNAYGHMQNYKLREFPQTLLEPLSTLEFKGKTFYAPADIPGFLEERYGPGWTKSDPTYEM